MKNVLTILSVFALLTMMSCGDSADKTKNAADEVKTAVDGKDHVCNDGCKDGKCNFVCGEKGHECTGACHADKKEAKAHVCNDGCKDGKCNFVCGEKGHECTEACHADKHEAKAHVCNDGCKDGKCNVMCGEKGHECTGACKS